MYIYKAKSDKYGSIVKCYIYKQDIVKDISSVAVKQIK
jgi:hypothetical protein